MKLFSSKRPSKSKIGTVSRAQGSALLVVITVLALMTTLLIANARVVWHLNREVRLIEKRQFHRWNEGAGPKPRAVAPRPQPTEGR